MSINWKDCTSYSRGKKRSTPRSWEAQVGKLHVIVTRLHGADQDQWYGHCFDLGIKDLKVGASLTADGAQKMFLGHIRKFLLDTLAEVEKGML